MHCLDYFTALLTFGVAAVEQSRDPSTAVGRRGLDRYTAGTKWEKEE